jgi:hypothetical protein
MTGHDLNITRFSQYWRRAIRAGHAYAEISARFRATSDPMWLQDSKSNIIRGGFWATSLLGCVALLGFSPVPLLLWLALLMAMSFRSGRRAHWKAPGHPALLLLYGIHSQLQQIPILLGQLQFDRNRRKGRRGELIEYKQGTGL